MVFMEIFTIPFVLTIGTIFACSALMYVALEKQLPWPCSLWQASTWGIFWVVVIWTGFYVFFEGWHYSGPIMIIPIQLGLIFLVALVFLGPAFNLVEKETYLRGLRDGQKPADELEHIYSGLELLEKTKNESEPIRSFITNGESLIEMVKAELALLAEDKQWVQGAGAAAAIPTSVQ